MPSSAVVTVPAEHGQRLLERVREAGQAGRLVRGQHDQDAEHRDPVEQRGRHHRLDDARRHVPGRVLHLLAGRVGQLEADQAEQDQRHQRDEAAGRRAGRCPRRGRGSRSRRRRRRPATLNRPSSRKRAIAPIVATHLPTLNDRIANSTPGPDEDRREDVLERRRVVLAVVEEGDQAAERGADQRPAHPDRVGHPVEEVVDRAGQVAERHPHPDVRAALAGVGRTQLGEQQRGRHREQQHADQQPGEALAARRGQRAQAVDPDQRAHQEEEDVRAAEVLLQLGGLLLGRRRLDLRHVQRINRFDRHACSSRPEAARHASRSI